MSNAGRAIRLLLALTLILGAGCSTVENLSTDLGVNDEAVDQQSSYEQVINPYLVKGRIYRNLGTEMLCTALPLTSKVRQARAKLVAEVLAQSAKELKQGQAAQQEAHAKYFEVVISFYVPDRKRNNLSGVHPDWLVYLVNQKGEKQLPVDRRRENQRSFLNQAVYPFWGLWDRLYILRWARSVKGQPFISPQADEVRLLITGARGRTILTLPLE